MPPRGQRRAATLRFVAVGILTAIALIFFGSPPMPDGLRWAQKARSRAALRLSAAHAGAYAPLDALPLRAAEAPPADESWFTHFPDAATWAATPRDITLVTQVGEGRIQYAGGVVARWDGPVVLALYVADASADARVRSQVAALRLPQRVTLLWLTANNASAPYPINALRNAAIASVRTSHFFLVDVDFFPSGATYGLMRALPPALLADPHALFTPPAFTTSGASLQAHILACKSAGCIERAVPESAEELTACASLEQCQRFCRPCEAHSTANYTRWQATSAGEAVAPATECFRSHLYEPYLLVPATRETPRFNEGFEGYGKNKIEWVHHLRFAGFTFRTLSRGAFVVHVVHRKSESNALWKQNAGRIQGRNNALYWAWMKHLSTRYAGAERGQLPICPGKSAALFERKVASAAAMLFAPPRPVLVDEAAQSAALADDAVVI
jgi:glycosyltransferase-like protein LARGE